MCATTNLNDASNEQLTRLCNIVWLWCIFYRFVGYIEIPESAFTQSLTKDTRQGVAVSYMPKSFTGITKKSRINLLKTLMCIKKECS